MNKFSLDIGKARYGWVNLDFMNNGKYFFHLNASGVYNPFYDLIDFLEKISKNKNGKYIWEIDQEGYDGVMTVIVRGKKIILKTKTYTSRKTHPPFKIEYNKKDFLYVMKCNLLKYYKENKSVIIDEYYPLDFNINQLRKIKW